MAKKPAGASAAAAAKHAKASRARATAPPRVEPGRVHVALAVSLDGYIAAPDGGVDWLEPYGDARAGFAPFMKTIGSMVMGRTTYDDAARRGHADFGDLPAYVVTHRPFRAPSPSVIPFTGHPADLVRHIRERHPRDIWLMGGGVLIRSFLDADLIDIWSIAFIPALLGHGLPMLPAGEFRERRLHLVSTRPYPSGVVHARYERTAGRR